ncbi:2514_t:CDS:2, partial [Racocetra persica]
IKEINTDIIDLLDSAVDKIKDKIVKDLDKEIKDEKNELQDDWMQLVEIETAGTDKLYLIKAIRDRLGEIAEMKSEPLILVLAPTE